MVNNSTVAKAGVYEATGTGGQQFPLTFPVLNSQHIAVWANDVEKPTAEYTVVLNSGGVSSGGSYGYVTFKSAYTLSSGTKVAIIRDVPFTQETDLPDNTRLHPHVMEDMADKATMGLQQLQEAVSRCAKLSPTDTETGDVMTVIRGYVNSAGVYATSASGCMTNASAYMTSAITAAGQASAYADSAWANGSAAGTAAGSAAAHAIFSAGGRVYGWVGVNSGADISGGMNVYGGMTVSGGLMVGSESAATQPWVIGQLGSSGFLKSEGGFTAYGQWTHSETVSGIVTSVWGYRPEIDFHSGFKTTVYYDTEAPSSSGWRAVFDVSPIGDYQAYPAITLAVSSGYVAAGILASLYGVRMWAPNLDGSAYVEVGSAGGFSIGDVDGEGGADGTSGTGIDGGLHSLVLSQYHTSSGLDAALILSGGRVAVRTSSGGNVRAGNVLLDTDPLPVPSGAIVSGAEFTTVVGGYTLDYGSDGLIISGGGVQFQVSSEVIIASNTETGGCFSLGVGGATIEDGYGGTLSVQAGNVGFGGGNVTANGDNVATESWAESRFAPRLDTATDSETTSASFDVLSGGTSYVYTQPISAFDITSIAPGCQAAMEFTAGANFTPSFPASAVKFGQSACDSGKHYVVVVNGSWVVVNEGRI